MTRLSIALLAALTIPALQAAGPSPAPEGAAVYFISPQDGDKVSSPVKIRFGLKNMGVAPAGVERQHTGHHHLLINMDALPPLDQPLPGTEQVVHFGGAKPKPHWIFHPVNIACNCCLATTSMCRITRRSCQKRSPFG